MQRHLRLRPSATFPTIDSVLRQGTFIDVDRQRSCRTVDSVEALISSPSASHDQGRLSEDFKAAARECTHLESSLHALDPHIYEILTELLWNADVNHVLALDTVVLARIVHFVGPLSALHSPDRPHCNLACGTNPSILLRHFCTRPIRYIDVEIVLRGSFDRSNFIHSFRCRLP